MAPLYSQCGGAMNIVEISGVIKDHTWGNTSSIPSLLGVEEDGKPKAELWFGTHPDGMATVVETGETLQNLLASDTRHWLGEAHLATFGEELPLLLKVLAIGEPLSIQVHPNKKQAEKGWAKEEHLRSRLHKEQWNYKDPNRKAEVGYALEPVTALSGFRPLKEIRAWLKRLIPSALQTFFSYLDEEGDEDGRIRRFFEALYTLEKKDLKIVLDELFLSLEDLPLESADRSFLTEKGIVEYCRTFYPLDPGLLAPFFLNVVHLDIGEGLFIPPGVLHAYMKGVVLEVMSNSDNVLRGGLTPKKVDLHELFSIVEVIGKPVELTRQLIGRSGRVHLLTPTEEFHLMVLHSGTYEIDERLSIELLFQTEGESTLKGAGEERRLKKGSCHVVAAGLGSYTLHVEGTLFIADVPR